jgi:hypothetical protein
MGGTGLEPVTPSLSNLGERSRPFAPVREKRIVKPNLMVDRTPERTERTLSVAIVATPLCLVRGLM